MRLPSDQENYRGIATRYSFPTLAVVGHTFQGLFREEACRYGDYELAERCPVLVFRTLA